jgi:hypothetical protein
MKKGKLRQTASTIIALVLTLVTTAFAQDFEPQYVGGYPTEETAAAMFDEYDYQAATQFYVWAYAYLNSLGMDKGFARLGGGERSFYVFDNLMQPQHVVMTANTEVVYTWSRFVDVSKGPVVFEIPPRGRGHFYDMGMRAYVDTGDVGPDQGKGGKYLVVASDYDGDPSGLFRGAAKVFQSNHFCEPDVPRVGRKPGSGSRTRQADKVVLPFRSG